MRIALITDSYAPMRISAAVQLADLAREFVAQGHKLLVMVPSDDLEAPFKVEELDNVEVLRVRAPKTKDVNYIKRTLSELYMPFALKRGLAQSPYAKTLFDGVVWYSPSIFHGPLVKALKRKSRCRSYLILRDIFPEWAVDMELLGRGLPYKFFKCIERYQYSVADVIGVQTPANRGYLKAWSSQSGRMVEVLQNWLAESTNSGCSISVNDTPLAGRKIFVYAGNMGVAQSAELILRVAEMLTISRPDIGFLFVGRGSEVERLKQYAATQKLDNVAFHDEIDSSEIPGLYAQCAVGVVALDSRHKTHNVPGKFLSYMQNGLPVFAVVNSGNDLLELIANRRVGVASSSSDADDLANLAQSLIEAIDTDDDMGERCKLLATELFSPNLAVKQIVKALQS